MVIVVGECGGVVNAVGCCWLLVAVGLVELLHIGVEQASDVFAVAIGPALLPPVTLLWADLDFAWARVVSSRQRRR